MSTTKKAPPAPIRRDPNDILAKLEQLIKNRKAPDGKAKSWIAWLAMALLAIAGTAVYAWVARRNMTELARLRHEHNKREILAKKAKVDAGVTRLRSAIKEMDRQKERLSEEIRRIRADYAHEGALYEANNQAIDRIRSWRDVSAWRDPGVGG